MRFSASCWLLLCVVPACGDGAGEQDESVRSEAAGTAETMSSGEPTGTDSLSPSTSEPASTGDDSAVNDSAVNDSAVNDSAVNDSAADDTSTDSASGEGESRDVPSLNDASSGGPSRDDAPSDDVPSDSASDDSDDVPSDSASDDSASDDSASDDSAADDSSASTASPNDAGSVADDAASAGDAQPEPARECAERTLTRPGGDAIEIGSFCDVVFVCVTSEQQRQFDALAPSFECSVATGEYGCSEVQCELRPQAADRLITADELAQICALGAEDMELGVIECRVYV